MLPTRVTLPAALLDGTNVVRVTGPLLTMLDLGRHGAIYAVDEAGVPLRLPAAEGTLKLLAAGVPAPDEMRLGVTVFELADGRKVFVCTELADNPGVSVTNAWPLLAVRLLDVLGGAPETAVFVEHYFPGSYRTPGQTDTFDVVDLGWMAGVATGVELAAGASMSRPSSVSYEDVARAAAALDRDGIEVTIPRVAEAVGRGSTRVISRYLETWRAKRKAVADIATADAALADWPVELRQAALAQLLALRAYAEEAASATVESALHDMEAEKHAAIAVATQRVADAEEKQLRAEGQCEALHESLGALQARLDTAADTLRALTQTVTDSELEIASKTQDLQHTRALLDEMQATLVRQREEHKLAQEAAEDRHQEELNRLSEATKDERVRLHQQLDNERQAAKREAKTFNETIAGQRASIGSLQADLAAARERNAALSASVDALNATVARLQGDLARLEAAGQDKDRAAITLEVRLETAEKLRQEAAANLTNLAQEAATLRAMIALQAAGQPPAATPPDVP